MDDDGLYEIQRLREQLWQLRYEMQQEIQDLRKEFTEELYEVRIQLQRRVPE